MAEGAPVKSQKSTLQGPFSIDLCDLAGPGGGKDVAGHLSGVTGPSYERWVCQPMFFMISRISSAVADGVLPTLTPAASRASCLAAAVPDEPDTMAPA